MNLLSLFRSSIQSPDQVEKEHLHELRDAFPYAAPIYWLAAAGNKDQLFQAAVYAPDRQRLHHYVKGFSTWPSHMLPVSTQTESSEAIPSVSQFSIALSQHIPTPLSIYAYPETSLTDGEDVFQISPVQTQKGGGEAPYLGQRCVQARALAARKVRLIRAQLTQFKLHTPKAEPIEISQYPNYIGSSEATAENNVEKSARLIDQFLDSIPSTKRTRKRPIEEKSEPAPESVRASIEVDEELVSETLARLFVKQKNYSEAIAMYEKLRLRFPDKSRYFDAQIEKIKQD